MKLIITHTPLTVERCRCHPDTAFVFGDNLAGWGKGGQAIIRDEPNAFGVPTKRRPSMDASAFMADDDFDENKAAILAALYRIGEYDAVVVHREIGCGRAQLDKRAPATYSFLWNAVLSICDKCYIEECEASEDGL